MNAKIIVLIVLMVALVAVVVKAVTSSNTPAPTVKSSNTATQSKKAPAKAAAKATTETAAAEDEALIEDVTLDDLRGMTAGTDFKYYAEGLRDPMTPLVATTDGKLDVAMAMEELSGMPGASGRTEPRTREVLDELASTIRLNAIVYNAKKPLALINNMTVAEGEPVLEDIIEGIKVEKINKNNVILRYRDERITLTFTE